MKLFGNKFFILFLILTVGLFSFSARVAHAGSVISSIFNAVASVFSTIINVVNVVVNTIVGNLEIVLGNITGINFLSSDGNCRLDNTNSTFVAIYSGECKVSSSGSLVLTPPAGIGCAFSYKPKFYIPNKDLGFEQDTFYDGYRTYDYCKQITVSENNNNVALYRFVRPSSISQSELSDWYFNIKNNIGNGFLNPWSLGGSFYYVAATDSAPLSTFPYSAGCVGNVCDRITDYSIPPDSYVIYAAKMLGDYTGASIRGDMNIGIECSPYPGLNKFLDIDNNSIVTLPDPSTTLGNAFIGPIKTGSCPISSSTFLLTVTKSGAGSGTITSVPAGINCGGACPSSLSFFISGLSVALTASPIAGSVFNGWSGDCSGMGACALTMDADKTVNAIFSLSASPVIPPSLPSATTTPPGGRREMPPQ